MNSEYNYHRIPIFTPWNEVTFLKNIQVMRDVAKTPANYYIKYASLQPEYGSSSLLGNVCMSLHVHTAIHKTSSDNSVLWVKPCSAYTYSKNSCGFTYIVKIKLWLHKFKVWRRSRKIKRESIEAESKD